MPEPLYRVFIRVPIPRGDFVDPPPVDWDSNKDEALWTILSKVAKTQINWTELAARFGVTVDFLLRQVAYLTEQHAAQVRDELRKAAAAAKGSAAPSPVPGSEPAATHQRTTSALSVRRDFPLPRNQPSGSGTPVADPSFRPEMARNTSGGSPAYSHNLGGGSTPRPTKDSARSSEGVPLRTRLSSVPVANSNPPSPGPADSTSDDSDDSSPAQSRIIRRPPRFQPQDEPHPYGDDDDDMEPAFQAANRGSSDLSATVRGAENAALRGPNNGQARSYHSQTSDSSTGSTAIIPRQHRSGGRDPPGPISPRTAQLAGRSPGGKNRGASREGSDGTPSMGSSYSDLDDSSVTQSAMAEALAAGIQDGAMGSRLSLAQSITRRFVPRRGN